MSDDEERRRLIRSWLRAVQALDEAAITRDSDPERWRRALAELRSTRSHYFLSVGAGDEPEARSGDEPDAQERQ